MTFHGLLIMFSSDLEPSRCRIQKKPGSAFSTAQCTDEISKYLRPAINDIICISISVVSIFESKI